MRIGLVACGVLEPHVQLVMQRLPHHEYRVQFLPAGLHANPSRLRELLQERIDAWSAETKLDGIVLGYGVCGRGAIGLYSRAVPLVIPRTQDCIGIFLGSHQRYLSEFNRRPGTRYMTQGVFAKTVRESTDNEYFSARDRSLYGTGFEDLARKYGNDNASYICEFRESWKRNYQRAAYIRFAEDPQDSTAQAVTEATARSLNWEFEVLDGDPSLLDALLDGRWSDPRVLLVPPYSKTVPSPGSEVLGFTTGFDCRLEVLLSRYRHSGTAAVCTRSGLGLGIDTGGTFTDAVIYDFEAGEVRAQAKHPTNHADLTSGIRGALAGLPAELLRGVRRVGLSTTLATNAFVERKGRKVALLVMSPIAVPLDALPFSYVRQLRGAMTIEGQETAPVDDAEIAAESVRARAAGCEAIAVSGFGGVINSAHEARVARIAFETTGLPAVCGHQLTSQLNFIERATTAAMNAKLVPLIEALLDAVRATLSDCGLDGVAVFVVKGDGSQMLDRVARETPVETVLSGPAASVIGALRLTGLQHAVIADMGGTTLDLALVRDGAPQLRNSGARIAGFQTSVRAMAVHTVGLGGDSEIDLSRWPTVRIGPRRIVPMCRMREDCPDAHERIAAVSRQLVSLERNSLDWIGLAPGVAPDSGLLTQLRDGPLSLQELAYRLLRPAPEYLDWQEYEDRGRIRRYGLTLTDILHVTGAYVAFDRDAAHQLLTLWATLLETDQESLVDGIYTEFRRVLCCEVLDVALPEACPWERDEDFVRWLTGHFASGQPAGQVQFGVKLAVPLVGVGAPAPVLFPQVKAILQTEICLPEHAGVANAVGAIAGDVRLQETAEVRVGEDQSLLCRWRGGLQRATNLEGALRLCEAQLTELLRQEAAANDVPFSTPEFAASVQEAETRDGTLFLGLSLTGCLRG